MKIWLKLIDLLYPPKCIICRQILDGTQDLICPDCKNILPYAGSNGAKRKCEFVEEVYFSFGYRGKLADAIKRFKFNGCKGYSLFFSSAMAECISEHLLGKFDIITWVPISSKRLRSRGYNQSQLLAEQISAKLNVEAKALLIKHKNTPPQSGIIEPERRKANILGVYSIPGGVSVNERRILIIDDVVTTGSTLSECAKTLLMGGADIVYGATIASAAKSKK